MKSFFLACTMLLVTLVAPAFADSLTFTNQGNLSGNITGGTVVSALTSVAFDGQVIPDFPLGTLSFDTGSFAGSFKTGGSFTGGNLAVTLDGGAVLFSSTISGTWTHLSNGLYELVGTFAGMVDGTQYSGSTIQFFGFPGGDDDRRHRCDDDGCGQLVDLYGTTNVNVTTVPEPSTLTFLGTGLIGIAGAVRRKLQAGRA